MTTIIAIISGTLLLFIITVILIIRRKRRISDPRKSNTYIEALHELLEGNINEALEKLKLTVRRDSNNIMAYLKLGDIYRLLNNPVQAAKIHRNLVIRGDLDEEKMRMVLFHLVQDYRDAGALDKAVEMAERLVEKNKKNLNYQKLLLSIYEEKNDWDKAFFYRQSLNKWQKKSDMPTLALYKIQAGLALTKANSEREGRIRFREALKLSKTCLPAYLYRGDSYRREQRDEEALLIWKEFTEKIPEKAHLAFSRLQDVLFDLGRYGELEKIYKKVISRKPGNPEAQISLAALYEKQGRQKEAIAICEEIIENNPESKKAMNFLVELYYENGDKTGALETALKVIAKETKKSASCSCRNCGNESPELIWHCPACGGWNTYLN